MRIDNTQLRSKRTTIALKTHHTIHTRRFESYFFLSQVFEMPCVLERLKNSFSLPVMCYTLLHFQEIPWCMSVGACAYSVYPNCTSISLNPNEVHKLIFLRLSH